MARGRENCKLIGEEERSWMGHSPQQNKGDKKSAARGGRGDTCPAPRKRRGARNA